MFTDTFIKKPVYSIVVSLFILILGCIGLEKIYVRQYPEVTPSVISVDTLYPGYSSKDIEMFITNPIEESLAAVDNLDYMTSDSAIGKSSVLLNFKLGADVNKALSDVYTSVAMVRSKLPGAVKEPIIKKIDPNKEPLMYLGILSDKKYKHADLVEYFDKAIKPSMQNVPGVGMVKMFGDYEYGMHFAVDPLKLKAHNLNLSALNSLIANESYYPGISQLESKLRDYPLRITGQAYDTDSFANVNIKQDANSFTRADQFSEVEMRSPKTNVVSTVQGKPAVFLGIIPTSDANPILLSKGINDLLAGFKEFLPDDFKIKIFWDSAIFIKQSLLEVKWTIFETAVSVIFILAVFLGSFRLAIVPAVTIPVSLIGTFIIMYYLGFSINTFTLLAMVLAIGMVVDDAIVVLENIYRNIEKGLTPQEATIVGAREICHPVIVMTLTLTAVFAPIGFIDGITGVLFREFAFTLAASVVLSGVVALTLSPFLCQKLLEVEVHKTKFAQIIFKYFDIVTNFYMKILLKVLPKKKTVIFSLLFMTIVTAAGLIFMPKALVPQEDSGVLMSFISGPPGANLNYMQKYTNEFDKRLASVDGVAETALVNGFMGGNSAMSIAILKPWMQRSDTADMLAQTVQKNTVDIAGIKSFVLNPFRVPGASRDMPLGFVVKTFGGLDELDKNMKKLINSIRDKKSKFYEWRIFYPNTKFNIDIPAYELKLNKLRLSDLGISNRDIGQDLGLALTDREGGQYAVGGQSRDWFVKLNDEYRGEFSALKSAYVMTKGGELVPLDGLFEVVPTVEPSKISHFQQLRSATFAAAALMPGYTMGDALAHIKRAAQSIFPKGTLFDYSSQSRTLIETSGHTFELYIYSILFIYLLMAIQYESFKDPFIILMCVPLAGLGALILLYAAGGSINMYTNIGMVTLIGLITKHGILLVDFANRAMRAGSTKDLAIKEAARARLRPILLTTFAMILAALPLVFASGAGDVARTQLGLTILGGMSIGTIMSLFIVPTLYLCIKPCKL